MKESKQKFNITLELVKKTEFDKYNLPSKEMKGCFDALDPFLPDYVVQALTESQELAAFLLLNLSADNSCLYVSYIKTLPAFQHNGIAPKLYSFASRNLNKTIIADVVDTISARACTKSGFVLENGNQFDKKTLARYIKHVTPKGQSLKTQEPEVLL